MREKNRDPGIIELKNLTDAEFTTLVIKLLNELKVSVDELKENFNKEIRNIKMEIRKWNQSEIMTMLREMKSILEGINRVEEEDRTKNTEDEEAKDTQSEQQEKEAKNILIIKESLGQN